MTKSDFYAHTYTSIITNEVKGSWDISVYYH